MLISVSSELRRQRVFGNLALASSDYVFIGGAADETSLGRTVTFTVFSKSAFDKAKLNRPVATVAVVNAESPSAARLPGILLLDVKYRGVGIGKKIVKLLLVEYGTLNIHEIKPTAAGFWSKLGATDSSGNPISDSYSGDAVIRV